MITKQDILTLAEQLHIPAVGVAPWPLPESAKAALYTDKNCPFTAGSLEERLHGNTKLLNPRSAIVCLFPYYMPTPDQVIPNLARYTWGIDYHLVVPTYLEKLGQACTALDPTIEFEVHCDTSPIADRYMAYLAGLGFYGVNKTFINPTWGSYTSIGTLLTNIPLEADQPLSQSCMNCNRCVIACPGNALGDTVFHFERCKSYLTQVKGELTPHEESIIAKTPLIFGCDVCQEVCPHNIGIPSTPIQEFQTILPRIQRSDIEEKTNKEFKLAYGNRSFSWRGKKVLLRNMDIVDHEQDL